MKTSRGWLAVASSVALAFACSGDGDDDDDGGQVDEGGGEPAVTLFEVENLVSDQPGQAENVDPALVNPWGVAFGPETFFWVANNGTSTTTLYDGEGGIHNDLFGGPIRLPAPPILESQASEDEAPGPTGIVFNGGTGFEIEDGVPSAFLFATTGGAILGWSANAEDPTTAVITVDNSARAEYFGLAIAPADETPRLYAANFAAGRIDVFDATFAPIEEGNAFVDPNLPTSYAPFNIQEIDGLLYVAYAERDPEEGEEVTGAGKGAVSVFDLDGNYVDRLASGGRLDAPWGLVRAPSEFGRFSDALLVGNFGDGRITAFADNGKMLGQLERAEGEPIAIDGLWALVFGNDRMAGEADDLYFTAGPDEEMHGIFGELERRDADDADEEEEADDDGNGDDGVTY